MKAYAIMFNEGVYYAGCRKADARTILEAQLFKSPKTALNVINKSINFGTRGESMTRINVGDIEINGSKASGSIPIAVVIERDGEGYCVGLYIEKSNYKEE